ncbi:hypothetical protein [Plantactinospora sp. GCM10030261]|uniref:hypothetical protein n=1 Tax=Plantactinospora sp. GCM10030261 TaxID=3273420 RepID=UPI00361B515A
MDLQRVPGYSRETVRQARDLHTWLDADLLRRLWPTRRLPGPRKGFRPEPDTEAGRSGLVVSLRW